MKNIKALNSFKNRLYNKSRYGNDGYFFEGIVIYEAMNTTVSDIMDIYLIVGGYEPMIKMDIYSKGEIITSDKYHLDFNPRFENLNFKHIDNQLIIEGKNSPKIGNYKITFTENQ